MFFRRQLHVEAHAMWLKHTCSKMALCHFLSHPQCVWKVPYSNSAMTDGYRLYRAKCEITGDEQLWFQYVVPCPANWLLLPIQKRFQEGTEIKMTGERSRWPCPWNYCTLGLIRLVKQISHRVDMAASADECHWENAYIKQHEPGVFVHDNISV